jgi:hypothetical protein
MQTSEMVGTQCRFGSASNAMLTSQTNNALVPSVNAVLVLTSPGANLMPLPVVVQ